MNLLHYNIILAADSNASFSDSIPQPLLNILIGLGIIFAALIFIAGLIYIIKSISNLSNNNPNGSASNSASPVNVPGNTNDGVIYEEELTDDLELVAVITAAIMASMGNEVPADGLVVRSIRKVNKRWQNA
jgi:glutaconyl-CoA/methylmalonyl-CoA decarboxylase subunit delta